MTRAIRTMRRIITIRRSARLLRVAALAGAVTGLGADALAQQAPAADPPRAARTLARGTVLTAADIAGASSRAESPVGWVTRRVVREGEALRAPAVGRAPVVAAGTAVSIHVATGRIRVSREGTALAEGAVGDTVLVRLDRRSTVPAVVLDSTTVRLLPTPIR